MTGRGWVDISEGLLLDALHMPSDTLLVSAEVKFSVGNVMLRLLVQSDDLPEVETGEDWPTFCPSVTRHPERYEWNWGDPL